MIKLLSQHFIHVRFLGTLARSISFSKLGFTLTKQPCHSSSIYTSSDSCFSLVLSDHKQNIFSGSRKVSSFSSTDKQRVIFIDILRTSNLSQSIKSFSTDDSFSIMADNKYIVGYAKLGTAKCKKCKENIAKGSLRIAKVTPNPFTGDSNDEMKQWFHPPCIFEKFKRARATTKKIEDPDDFSEGFTDLKQEDKDVIIQLIDEFTSHSSAKPSPKPKKTAQATSTGPSPDKKKHDTSPSRSKASDNASPSKPAPSTSAPSTSAHSTSAPSTSAPSTSANRDDPSAEKDNSFRAFRRLCADIAEENSYLGKTNLVKTYIEKGHSGDGFHGDLYLLMKLLLPGVVKVVYNLNNKQLVKLFSQIFGTNLQRMVNDLNQGDVAETIRAFFEESKVCIPQKKCTLSIQEVDAFLEELSQMTREDDQQRVLIKIAKRCTANDLKMVVRLIKRDLRINAGAKHILDGLDPNAYAAFQASSDLRDVVSRVLENKKSGEPGKKGLTKTLSVKASLMTPLLPMLAEACRSVDQAMKKCPNGFYAEIKYDGERVQLHKRGDEFKYFSRSLKPVVEHKVRHFRDFIPKAFPTSSDLILDGEVLLVDNNTGVPLPFGTLGVHKKAAFKDATVCLFIFDCLLINDENLMDKPLKQRRSILESNMRRVENRVHLSEFHYVTKPAELQQLMAKVFREGLEGLVLKDVKGVYEPGKRHWLKVKKDYLNEGKMADSADLVVLGAYYGTGNKGGMMSIFLMGVYDPDRNRWVTVSKCGNGFDDKKLEQLNKELDMVEINKDFHKVPKWLHINKSVTPDFVVKDPKAAPVWEIIGAEFSKAEIHTADGISIRFPRVQKIREDKTWREATDLPRLKKLFKKSKEKADSELLAGSSKKHEDDGDDGSGTDVDENDVDDADDDDDRNRRKSKSREDSTHSQKGVKRKASGDDDGPSPSKKSKPMCKFGSTCYQKNPKHFSEFQHPTAKKANDTPSPSSKGPDTSGLPSIFHGCRIMLPKTINKFRELKRFIVAYDGDLVQEFEENSASHIILDGSGKSPKGGSHAKKVSVNWLWDCIKKKRLLDTSGYQF